RRARSVRPRPSSLAARLPWLLPAAIALVTALAFLPSVRYGFMDWDDNAYVTENAMIRDSSLQGVGALFGTFIEGNYQPLTIASYSLDYRLWKLDPRGYHITNVVLHTLATVSVFAFVFLLAVDLYLKRGWNLKLLLEKAPMFLIAIVFGYLSVVAQTRQGAVQALASYPLYERILFACYGISAYLIRAIAPAGLSAFYPYP